MLKKILIGGLAAGILVFIWGAVSHMVLPLGRVGFKELPAEDVVVNCLKNAIKEPGLYEFAPKPAEGEASAEAGPSGLVLYQAPGGVLIGAKTLGVEFASNVLGGLIAALLVALTSAGFVARVLCVMLLGLFGWLAIDVSYWNWYQFPLDFTGAALAEHVIGWLIAGLAIAAIVKPSAGHSEMM